MQQIQFVETAIGARGESIPVHVVGTRGALAGPGDLLFLHGYGRDPRDYGELLRAVVARGHRVVAPFLFANAGLESPPLHFWACAGLAQRTLEALGAAGLIHRGAPIFGHSTGGAVALALGRVEPRPRALVAFNPVQPSEDSPGAFMVRSAWMNTKMALGLSGQAGRARRVLLETGGRFYWNWLRQPAANFRLIGGLRAFSYRRLADWYGAPSSVPATVVYGHGDEFYPSAATLQAGLDRVFSRATVIELPEENSHEWLLLRPERAAQLLEDALP